MKKNLRILALYLGMAAWVPSIQACPLCFGSTPFAHGLLWAAVFLLPLPLLLIGGLVFWIRRQAQEEESQLNAPPPGGSKP